MAFLSNENSIKQLKQDKAYNLALLQDQYQIGPAQIDALFHYAKFQFECGNYSAAAEFLYHFRWQPHPADSMICELPSAMDLPSSKCCC